MNFVGRVSLNFLENSISFVQTSDIQKSFPRICLNQHFRALLIFDKSVYVMLGPVLGSWDFKNIGDAKKGFLSVTIGYYLKNCEVLQHAIHHVLFW